MSTSFSPRASWLDWNRKERRFALALAFFVLLACALPPVAQPQGYHQFADGRALFGIPRALDVLSNLGFLCAGLFGLLALAARGSGLAPALKASLGVFFAGVVLTAIGSAFYHLAPQDGRLVWDRLPMTIAFAGVCGCLGSARVSSRAGWGALWASLAYGLGSVWLWSATGNLAPYVIMQFGGLAWVAVAWVGGARRPVDPPWGALLGFYLAAKLFESLDAQTFAATLGLVSGHTVKHLLSAMGAGSFAWSVWRGGRGSPEASWLPR